MVAQVEVPDGYRVVTLVGVETDGTPQVVQLDGTGRIVAVIQGEIEGITGPVDVTQTDSTREVQGSDGSTLRTVALDANGQLIMVPRGQSGNYMSVDASGFLTAVMKGDYAGSPTTLTVDSSGNIVAVIKGDYGGTLKTLTTDADGRLQIVPYDPDDIWGNAVGTGNAELAAVLSHAKRYDRRGQVFLADDFEKGFAGWTLSSGGTGAHIALSSQYVGYGSHCLKLAAGSTSTYAASISRYLPYPAVETVGLSVLFKPMQNVLYLLLGMYLYDGTSSHIATAKVDFANSHLQYSDSDFAYQTILTRSWSQGAAYPYHYLKLVADFATDKYYRLLFDGVEYDLSAYSLYTAVSATEPRLYLTISTIGTGAGVGDCRVDSVVATHNEPA